MRLTFYGGVGEVTGANYILESGGKKIMIDCGLHQGGHYAERRNFEPFPYDPKNVEAVFITHSHIDHIGLLPKLWKDGFRGTVYSTPATKRLRRTFAFRFGAHIGPGSGTGEKTVALHYAGYI